MHPEIGSGLHVANDACGKLAGSDLGGPGSLALKIVCNEFLENCLLHRLFDQLGSFLPADEIEQHNTRKNYRTGIDYVLIGILGSRAVCRLEDCVAVTNVG